MLDSNSEIGTQVWSEIGYIREGWTEKRAFVVKQCYISGGLRNSAKYYQYFIRNE